MKREHANPIRHSSPEITGSWSLEEILKGICDPIRHSSPKITSFMVVRGALKGMRIQSSLVARDHRLMADRGFQGEMSFENSSWFVAKDHRPEVDRMDGDPNGHTKDHELWFIESLYVPLELTRWALLKFAGHGRSLWEVVVGSRCGRNTDVRDEFGLC
jgi:hypothetical protein